MDFRKQNYGDHVESVTNPILDTIHNLLTDSLVNKTSRSLFWSISNEFHLMPTDWNRFLRRDHVAAVKQHRFGSIRATLLSIQQLRMELSGQPACHPLLLRSPNDQLSFNTKTRQWLWFQPASELHDSPGAITVATNGPAAPQSRQHQVVSVGVTG